MTSHPLAGTRVRMNEKGKAATFRCGDGRQGILVGENKTGSCWIVKWDGYKSTTKLHKSFVDVDADAPPPKTRPAVEFGSGKARARTFTYGGRP